MIRANNLARVAQKRTIRPLYAWHSAVPYACFADMSTGAISGTVTFASAGSVYPGQVAIKTTGELMRVSAGGANANFGLFNNFIGGTMDELAGGTEIGVWVGGRDAVFEVLAGFSSTETPLDPAAGWVAANTTLGGAPVYAKADGRLTLTAESGGLRVARLIEAVSASKIIVQLSLAEA